MERTKSTEGKKTPQELRAVLQNGGMLMIDLDDTVKEASKYTWPDGKARRVLPETAEAFRTIHQADIPLGIATEQAFTEIEPFLADVTKLTLGEDHDDPYELFNGLIIGEGGNVVRRPARDGKEAELVIVAPEGAMEDRKKMLSWLEENLEETDLDGWKTLPGVDPEKATYVSLPGEEDQAIATLSLWEKGPHVTEDPTYLERYQQVEKRIQQVFEELEITTLNTYEAGNGTLRIVPRTASKAHTIELLAAYGAVDRSKIVYACDGPNDVALAQQLKRKGGSVIAVGNAVLGIHAVADISATQTAGRGFAEAMNMIFGSKEEASLKNVQRWKLLRRIIRFRPRTDL